MALVLFCFQYFIHPTGSYCVSKLVWISCNPYPKHTIQDRTVLALVCFITVAITTFTHSFMLFGHYLPSGQIPAPSLLVKFMSHMISHPWIFTVQLTVGDDATKLEGTDVSSLSWNRPTVLRFFVSCHSIENQQSSESIHKSSFKVKLQN